jgi:hypothetical protein
MTLLEQLVVGSYIFTASVTAAGARAFYYLYKLVTNHHTTQLTDHEARLHALEQDAQAPDR